MTPQAPTKSRKKKPATLDDLIQSVQHLSRTMEHVARTVQLLVRENQKLLDVLLEDDEPQDRDDREPEVGLDGSRLS